MSYETHGFPNTPNSPTRSTRVITPSDTATFPGTKSILVLNGGTVVLRCSEDETPQTFPNLPPMTELLFEVVQVLATSTTATDIRACY